MPAAFPRRFADHNRQVIGVTVVLALMSLGFWAFAYCTIYLLSTLALTIFKGLDARPPESYPILFAIGALASLLLAWFARRWLATPGARENVPRHLRWLLEIALAGPMTTLSAGENLTAFRWLSASEMQQAWQLLHELGKAGSIELHQLPALIAGPRQLEKIVMALQLANLIVIRQQGTGWVVALRDQSARTLSRPGVRLHTKWTR
jgi:hypothetical protein